MSNILFKKTKLFISSPYIAKSECTSRKNGGGGLFVEMYEFGVGGPSGLRMCGVLQNSSDKCGQL